MARKRLLTVEEAILLHLLDNIRYMPEDDVPLTITQAGISRALGVRRSHISTSLDFAKNRGTVEEHLSRVRGEKRKRKCYFLTPAGLISAKETLSRVLESRVQAVMADGTAFSGTFESLLSALKSPHIRARLALLCIENRLTIPPDSEPATGESARVRLPEIGELLGRENELELFKSLFSGEASLLFLTGMPGIGKTWLAADAASRFGGESVFWYTINEWGSPRNLASHLAHHLSGIGSSRLERYLETHEIPDPADVHDILLDIKSDLNIILDDCQNSGPAMASFLDMLASACAKSPNIGIAMVGRHIPGPVGKRANLGNEGCISLELKPLDEASSLELLTMKGISEELARSIAKKSGGHPLFLTLAGRDSEKGERYNIEKMLAAEVSATLSDRENELMAVLSVFRVPVSSDALAESQEDLEILESLKKRSLLSDNSGWCMHALLRDFYLARQAPADRASRHERAAEYYNHHPGNFSNRIEEVHHLLMAGDAESAILAIISRGTDMLARGYVDELLALCDLVPETWANPDDALGLGYLKASALDLIGNWEDAASVYRDALGMARELGDRDREAAILRRLGAIHYRQGNMAEAKKLMEIAMGLTDSPPLVAELHGSLGVVMWKMGDSVSARKAHESDLSISTARNDRVGMARALNNLGILDWEAGNNPGAMERYSRALKMAQKNSDTRLVAILYSNMGDVQRSMGNADDAKRYYERCLELAEDLKFNWQVAEAYRSLSEIVPEKRRDYLSRALTIFERLGADEDAKTVREMIA